VEPQHGDLLGLQIVETVRTRLYFDVFKFFHYDFGFIVITCNINWIWSNFL